MLTEEKRKWLLKLASDEWGAHNDVLCQYTPIDLAHYVIDETQKACQAIVDKDYISKQEHERIVKEFEKRIWCWVRQNEKEYNEHKDTRKDEFKLREAIFALEDELKQAKRQTLVAIANELELIGNKRKEDIDLEQGRKQTTKELQKIINFNAGYIGAMADFYNILQKYLKEPANNPSPDGGD